MKDEASGEKTPIENDSFEFLNDLNNRNESLITYVLDDENFILFDNEKDFSIYMNTISSTNKSTYSKVSSPYDNPYSLRIYSNSNYNGLITWHSAKPNGGPQYNGCYFQNGTNSERLRNFSDSTMWKVLQNNQVVLCGSNAFIGNIPNDKVSSVRVSSCYGRFYEHINYGGRSFVLDARNSSSLQISNLKRLRRASWGRNWNDEISSIKLLN
ncbi:hypothetical protein FEZ18_12990 [Oceanihabitans sp. IOP_32]|uniref:hypothetical protein n=1 Tax=Oceanihabitans sp. IOP_32 TaxID=2529032 RepID=UPI0012935E96|nr:hypothetical protein [Oceanihabitans sp. IOP_32]QFZ55646.1 hypothetical protein FEZ18_12990 [Oceanihabitans sp. IOP_32]